MAALVSFGWRGGSMPKNKRIGSRNFRIIHLKRTSQIICFILLFEEFKKIISNSSCHILTNLVRKSLATSAEFEGMLLFRILFLLTTGVDDGLTVT